MVMNLYHADSFFFLWGSKGPHVKSDLIGVDQKVPDWLIKIVSIKS